MDKPQLYLLEAGAAAPPKNFQQQRHRPGRKFNRKTSA
jgi:hypothetical protein